ncbi:hypothetical protein EBZ80_07610 [bacterium]|nr:hypothetical protein [bacterium]
MTSKVNSTIYGRVRLITLKPLRLNVFVFFLRSIIIALTAFVSLSATSFAAGGKSGKPGETRVMKVVPVTPAERNLVALLDAVTALSRRDEIAYVWGGRTTSSPVVCAACQRCVEQRHVPPERRVQQCPACAQCGVDCSGFVSRVMRAAGIGAKRITSRSLIRSSVRGDALFRPVGRSLDKARPGDLIVLPDHVVIFLNRHPDKKLDYVHASRFIPGRPAGGIEVVTMDGKPIERTVLQSLPRGQKPVAILRARDLEGAGDSLAVRYRIAMMIEHAVRKKIHQHDPRLDLRLAHAH